MKSLYELNKVKYFHGDKEVLDIEHLKLDQSQIIGFLGPNGSGKTTLFNILSFVEQISSGDLLYKGINSKKLLQKDTQEVVMLPQNPYLLKRSVYENIVFGLKLRKDLDNIEQRVKEALSYVGLNESFLSRKWSQLSGGEAQRVALCARLILKPKVLILDEPTSGVDVSSAQLIKEAIFLARQKWDTTILVSSHDHNWLNHVCDQKVGLFRGKIVQNGSINLLFAPWEKDENGNLVKIFSDNQKLTFKNSKQKKRDSVVMINSDLINLYTKEESRFEKNLLKAVVNSIHQEQHSDELVLELIIGTVSMNANIKLEQIRAKNILPCSEVLISIDTQNACWI